MSKGTLLTIIMPVLYFIDILTKIIFFFVLKICNFINLDFIADINSYFFHRHIYIILLIKIKYVNFSWFIQTKPLLQTIQNVVKSFKIPFTERTYIMKGPRMCLITNSQSRLVSVVWYMRMITTSSLDNIYRVN